MMESLLGIRRAGADFIRHLFRDRGSSAALMARSLSIAK